MIKLEPTSMGHAHTWSSIYIDLSDHNVYPGSSRFATPHMLLVVAINRPLAVVSRGRGGVTSASMPSHLTPEHHCVDGEVGSRRCPRAECGLCLIREPITTLGKVCVHLSLGIHPSSRDMMYRIVGLSVHSRFWFENSVYWFAASSFVSLTPNKKGLLVELHRKMLCWSGSQ